MEGQIKQYFLNHISSKAESENVGIQLLSSAKVNDWRSPWEASIQARQQDQKIAVPIQHPIAQLKNNLWYLIYEQSDKGIWLATSHDMNDCKNIQDEPVLVAGLAITIKT